MKTLIRIQLFIILIPWTILSLLFAALIFAVMGGDSEAGKILDAIILLIFS